jgi:hypothetical protein
LQRTTAPVFFRSVPSSLLGQSEIQVPAVGSFETVFRVEASGTGKFNPDCALEIFARESSPIGANSQQSNKCYLSGANSYQRLPNHDAHVPCLIRADLRKSADSA